jgi:choline dehydrogenase-like flavoprotein
MNNNRDRESTAANTGNNEGGIEWIDAAAENKDSAVVNLRTDACIIGSGAGGSVVAYELTNKDKDVVILERGGYYDVEFITRSKEYELAKLWKNKGVFLSRNYSINIAQGECVGGSTMINYGICFEIPEQVKEFWRHEFGIDISDERWQDAFTRVSRALGRRKIVNAGRAHELFKQGCDALGYSNDWMDKAYVPGEGPGTGKVNAIEAFLKRSKPGKLRIVYNCMVDKIRVSGKTASLVTGHAYSPDGKRAAQINVESKTVILAAGPIASSECLLKSGITGANGHVGKFLSLHPSSSLVAKFDEPLNADEGMAMACYCDEFSVRKTGKPGFMLESVFVPPSQLSITLPSFGQENRDHLRKYDNYAMAGVLVHDEPHGSIELNWSKEAVVNYELGATDQLKMIDGIREAARVFLRAGAKYVITGHMKTTILKSVADLRLVDSLGAGTGSLLVASAHPQGGNRMGQNPANSVVNKNGQFHAISNLFISDASIFPTSVGVNPQMTVMALATIIADYINANT